jgi:site-specific DNA recombinase
MDREIRVAIYARVSTEEQATEGYSIRAQLDVLRTYCKQHSPRKIVVGEYVDEGISGKSMEGRLQLQRLLADAEARRFDEAVVWKTNRLARNLLDLQMIVATLERCSVSFRSYSEPFETATPAGKLLFNVLGSIGEFERSTIVENVKLGMRQRAKGGLWNGGVVLGYASVPPSASSGQDGANRLAVLPEEAAVVRHVFGLYAAGKGLKAIANQLNREGHRTKYGNAFSTAAVALILDNPVYVGKIRFGVHQDWAEKRRKGTSRDHVLADGQHEPIIAEDLWGKVRALREAKKERPPRTFDGDYPLTGLMRCPVCGAAMVSNRTRNVLKDGTVVIRRYYVCGNFRSKGASVCRANGVNADAVEAHVFDRLEDAVTRPKVLRDVVQRVNARRAARAAPLRQELESLARSLERAEGTQRKYFELYERDGIDSDLLVSRLDELRAEVARITARRAEVEAELEASRAEPVPLEAVRDVLRRFHEVLRAAPTDQRKTLLQLVVKEVRLSKDRKVEGIDIRFDESVQAHFIAEAPSAQTGTEGAFPVPGGGFTGGAAKPLSISITL